MAMTRAAWTISGLAVELDKSRRYLGKLISRHSIKPVGKQGRAQTYHLADVVAAMLDDQAPKATADAPSAPTNVVQFEQARLTKHRADLAELDSMQRSGALAPREILFRVCDALALIVRKRLEALPDRGAPLVVDVDSIAAAHAALDGLCQEILEELQRVVEEELVAAVSG